MGDVAVNPVSRPVPAFAGYRLRFLALYCGLGVVLAACLAAVVLLAEGRGFGPPSPWAAWKPASGSVGASIHRIARHVANEYRLGETDRGHLTTVLAAIPPQLAGGSRRTEVPVLFRRRRPDGAIQVLPGDGTAMYSLCGRMAGCSARAADRLLARRQALELALLTLRYVHAVNSVLVFPPPAPGEPPTRAMLFDRDGLAPQLAAPLATTLPLARPPLAGDPDRTEKRRIDALTLPHLYRFRPVELPTGGVALSLLQAR
jgi:hypothetical protein